MESIIKNSDMSKEYKIWDNSNLYTKNEYNEFRNYMIRYSKASQAEKNKITNLMKQEFFGKIQNKPLF